MVNIDAEYLIFAAIIGIIDQKKMNSAFAKVTNLKVNRAFKIAITLTSSTFFLYALGQTQILKNIIAGAFSCSS